MNSLFSHYDRTSVSRRLSRHGHSSSTSSAYSYGKRRPATTEKLQAGESYSMGGMGRNSGLLSMGEDGGGSNSRNPYLSSGSSPYEQQQHGGGGRFLQDIHVPSRSQRMPTPMPMRSREMLMGRSSSLPSRSSKYGHSSSNESSMGHESSSSGGLDSHPLLLRSVSRKGSARGAGGGASDTNSIMHLGGDGGASVASSQHHRRRHKSDSAAILYNHHEQQQQQQASAPPQPLHMMAPLGGGHPPSTGSGLRGSGAAPGGGGLLHGHHKPGSSSAASRWQLQLPDINHSSGGGGAAASGPLHPSSSSSSSSSSSVLQQQGGQAGSSSSAQVPAPSSSSSTSSQQRDIYSSSRRSKSRHHHQQPPPQHNNLLTEPPEFLTQAGSWCGLCTIKGLKPGNPNWQNQDSFVMCEGVGPKKDVCVYGVLDGHGEVGHLVSNRCREQLPLYLAQVDYDPTRACRLMQQDLIACQAMDVQCSGATCVLAVLRTATKTLTVANLGDSRCVLGRLQQPGTGGGGGGTKNQQQQQLKGGSVVVAVPLTRDHKPDRPDEHQRILAAGGQVGCRQIILSQRTSHPVTLPMGPPRVWYQCRGEIMGLAMSRSLGDSIVHTVGGSSEPEITEYRLVPSDAFMIIASDGIWDVLDNNQAVQIVQSYASRNPEDWDAKEAANILSRFARHRWQTVSSMVDDITCLVVKLPATAATAPMPAPTAAPPSGGGASSLSDRYQQQGLVEVDDEDDEDEE